MSRELPKRKHPRLKIYDYSSAGAYFVTICTKDKKCIFASPRPTIPQIICAYKSITARVCKKQGLSGKLFQASFYDHVIRNDKDLEEIQRYILENPLKWQFDKLYVE